MTNKFFNLLQPTIVKTSDHKDLPSNLRNKFFVNYNVIAINYFDENFILGETSDGDYYLTTNQRHAGRLITEDSNSGKIIDIPRLYINITDKFIEDSSLFRKFITSAIKDNKYYYTGIEGFVPGEDYWVNCTLNQYLSFGEFSPYYNTSIEIPNYLVDERRNVRISEYFIDISDSPMRDYTNLDYYKKKNKEQDHKFAKEELMNFYSNFCKEILEKTLISDELRNSGNNPLYNLVLNYFANYQSDEALNALNIVLNNLYSSTSSTSSCTCNSTFSSLLSSNNQEIYTKTCSTLYEEAMNLYIEQMLGDIQFYKDWFFIELSEYDCVVNDLLVDTLITMLTEFIDMDFDLDFDTSIGIHSSFACNTNINSDENISNYKILNNYLKVLNFVKTDNMIPNTNKIKIWGGNFGKLLPALQF